MSLIFLPIGLLLPTLNGWLILAILQKNKRILFRGEQWVMGCVMGLLLSVLILFISHVTFALPFSRWLMITVHASATVIFYITAHALKCLKNPAPILAQSQPFSRTVKMLIGTLGSWTIIKTLTSAVVFLTLTPTFLDDTLDNWNLRGKVFYEDQALTLAMPAEDIVTSPLGVSSYSPAVPLMKTWFASLAGEWSESLINSIHVIWYIAAIVLLYYVLRRLATKGWALLGVYILGSMPLYLMHGTNPYADAFVSVHVFIAVSMLFLFFREDDSTARTSFMHIGAVATGILPFTKNEGLLLYVPPILFILCIGLFLNVRNKRCTMSEARKTVLWYGLCIAALALPWLLFKWSHGLTFGNAKSFTDLGIGWQEGIVIAWWINTFFEGNWLFLFPLVIGLLVWKRRAAFSTYIIPATFFLIVYIGQIMIFLFTGLSAEARMQTGLARGVIQLLPVIVLVTTVLLWEAREKIEGSLRAIWTGSV